MVSALERVRNTEVDLVKDVLTANVEILSKLRYIVNLLLLPFPYGTSQHSSTASAK